MTLSSGISTASDSEDGSSSPWRQLEPGQRSQLIVFELHGETERIVLEADDTVIEAPNWSRDGEWLVVNSEGLLYRVAVHGDGAMIPIDTGTVRDSNNDHVLSADGRFIYVSSQDGHLYEIPFRGGMARRVTDDSDGLTARYLHGVSPDGRTLAFIGAEGAGDSRRLNVFTQAVDGATVTRLTDSPLPHDGAEYSPDGQWIYFNSERESERPGHAQLFRMRADGSNIVRLTFDERVNWFPHPAPDGGSLLHISYQRGVTGHPGNETVQLRISDPLGGDPRTLVTLFGGQGTVNVNSWAPDSRRFAYVAYPIRSSS